MKDLEEAEASAFKGFLLEVGANTLNEYESSRSNEAVKHVNLRKNELL
jgi:hypothetical protein